MQLRDYQPNAATRAQVANIDAVAVVGPSAVGKDSVMTASGLHIAKGQTSRSRRPNELSNPHSGYTFVCDTESRDKAIEDLRAGNYVQGAMYATGEFYGLLAGDFPIDGTALIDVAAREHRKLRASNLFRSTVGIYVVAPSFSVWQRRLEKSDRLNDEYYPERMAEACSSLIQSLADPDLHLLNNGDLKLAADELMGVATGYRCANPNDREIARQAGQDMLSGLLHQRGQLPAAELDRWPMDLSPVA